MWFEMQRVGIEGVFCGIKTPFPSQETVFENSALFRRTGCSSIVAIGNGALADCAKATRRIVSSGNGSNDHAESFFLAIVPTTISPVHTISSEGLLHKEEDTLIHSVCEPADMVLFDPTILEKSPYSSSPNISRSYLLSHLFETLIALRLARSENVAHFEEIISQLERCAGIRSLFDSANTLKQSFLLQLEENPSDPLLGDAGRTSTASGSGLIRAAAELGVLRSQTQRLFRSLQPADYPGFIETAAMSSLTHEGSSGLLPYSWAAMAAFGSLLRVMEGSIPSIGDGSSDDALINAAAEESIAKIELWVGVDRKGLLKEILTAVGHAQALAAKKPRLFRSPLSLGTGLDGFVASGCLEKLSLLEEMKFEKSDKRSLRESKIEKIGSSLRLKLLRSDLLLDTVQTKCSPN